ncbi:MAG TPA: alpha-glucosidase C-terminal domain-containing protein, partial [Virgibacillus sp.]
NYKEINAKDVVANPDSIFHYYKELIQLRKKHPIIVYGKYDLLNRDSENIFAYTRTYEGEQLLVVSNFTKNELSYNVPEKLMDYSSSSLMIGNYKDVDEHLKQKLTLNPFETRVYYLK